VQQKQQQQKYQQQQPHQQQQQTKQQQQQLQQQPHCYKEREHFYEERQKLPPQQLPVLPVIKKIAVVTPEPRQLAKRIRNNSDFSKNDNPKKEIGENTILISSVEILQD
jgi:hypothetical protein